MNATKQKYYSEHRERKFKSEKAFEVWLKRTATHRLEFVDKGQDCLAWIIDAGGEVLHAEPFQARIWNGMVVDLSRVGHGQNIGVMDTPKQQTKFYDFMVKRIIPLKNKV